jgi:hypothetical protein
MNERQKKISLYCDGLRTSREIAEIVDDNVKYVQRTMKKFDLPRLPQAPRCGEHNPSYKSGKTIDLDGYALVSAPLGHPYARKRVDRKYGHVLEHRLVMENTLGRYLEPHEVVDHIDGLHLHNDPSNLRLFDKNSSHLKKTLKGNVPKWSAAGLLRMRLPMNQRANLLPVDTYNRRKKLGEIRLQQILLAWLQFDINSPFLLGTHHHLEKIQVDYSSHLTIKQELDSLYLRWEQDH